MEQKNIQQYLTCSNQAYIIIDNNYCKVNNLDKLNDELNQMLNNSRSMPAFGVSIHTETIKAIQNGIWLKLQYNETKNIDGMCFDELLIEIKADFTGFNIIRGNKGIYDGRCYYIDLQNNTMRPLFELIKGIYGN